MRRLFLFLLCFSVAAVAQGKHPFTFEDMMKLKRVGEPVPSPDGKWVAFSVVDVSLEANTKTPHVWIVPLSSADTHVGTAAPGRSGEPSSPRSAEREIIPNQDSDRPRWSPDGKHFLFLSSKDGGQQVWIADFDPATGTVPATHRLTSIATEADGPLWSPDGKNIVFTSSVYPECTGSPEEAAACNAMKLDEAAKSKVKAQIFTRLLYRHWNAYQEGKRNHLFVVAADGGTPRDLTPGDFDAPVFSLGGQDNYAISPDGQELCYTSNHDKVEATSTNNDLWIVPIAGGEAKNITADNPASDSTPLYSPDGKYIAYRAQERPGYESDQFKLVLYDRGTGQKKDLIGKSDWEDWGSFTWARNPSEIFFVGSDQDAQNKGQKTVWDMRFGVRGPSVQVPEGKVLMRIAQTRQRITRGYDDDLVLSSNGTTLFFTQMSLENPAEIRKIVLPANIDPYDLPDGERITHLNDGVLSRVAMSPVEPFWFKGAENARVQGFLVKPPNFDPKQKYPIKLLIHGGPQGAWGDEWSYRWNAELFAANGYMVLMINPRGSTGYGQKFIDDINGDWGGRAFEDLMKGLDYAEQTYPFIDKDRECALGASYGGYMINWILGHTDRFKCLVSHDGMFNADSAWGSTEELWFNEWEFQGTPWTNREIYRKWSPHLSAANFKTPTLVIHSQKDYRLDVSEGLQLFTTLQRMNVPSKMLYFPDEGHWVLKPQNSQLWYKTVNDWVDQWIGTPGMKDSGTKK
jgi:dipeptidyl aminopeptidase/acylaminoacyl peptidase